MKIFGVGLNRTGTLTLCNALAQLGFQAQHWEASNYRLYRARRIEALFEVADEFDVLTDWPWPLMAGKLLERYGEQARFVLTTRSDANTWLRSLARHASSRDDRAARRVRRELFGATDPLLDPERHKELYLNHNEAIRGFFDRSGRSHQLLEVCWDDGDDWARLCSFVGCAIPALPFPHHNSADQRRNLGFVGESTRELAALAAYVTPLRKAG